MSTFCLVHGAFHGSWCWQLLGAELESRGHRVVAPDLPCDDPAAGAIRYAEVVLSALAGSEPPVLVGHSLAGLTVPLVAVQRPVKHLVYLCAFVPQPGRAMVDWMPEETDMSVPNDADIWPVTDDDGLMTWPPAKAIAALYPDCDPDIAAWAAGRLRRQSLTPHREPCPLDRLPDVPVSMVYGEDDLDASPAWLQRVARQRLGIEARGLPGGHSPFLARPAALADLLEDAIAETGAPAG